ncbi:MAG: ABC transporter permease [Acidobacteriia bacterium]|nr:ABC transporter permease [Terriglobia bacterium]
MSLFTRLSHLKRYLFQKERVEEDLDREIRAYVELLTDEKIRAGMNPKKARRTALIDTGGVELVKEQVRDVRALAWLDSLWQDTRYAVRNLRKNLGFTSVAVLSLALGIGANATIFSVFYGVLLRPLPYRNPERLVSVGRVAPGEHVGGVMTPELVAWRAGNRAFEGLAAWDDEHLNLTGAGTPERIATASVTSNFLDVLGVQPTLGRGFAAEDGHPGAPGAILLVPDFWRRHFNSDPTVVGRIVLLNDVPSAVLGVLPDSFRFPGDLRLDALVASRLPAQPDWKANLVEGFNAIGRLRAGVGAGQAASDLAAISSSEAAQGFIELFGGKSSTVQVVPLHQRLVGNTRPALAMLLGAVFLLLLIACVNVASLQLGRAAVRAREIGLRAALGASRGRLARLLVIENLVLAIFAGLAGLLVASVLVDLLAVSSGLPLRDPRDLQVGWVLGSAAFALSTAAGLLIGLVPAVLAPRLNLNEVLKSGALSVMGGRGAWVRSALVLSQVALALVLLIGSGLLLRSLGAVLAVDPGFRPEGVLTAGVRLPDSRYGSDPQQHAFVQSLVERVSAFPGVETVAVTNGLPLAGYSFVSALRAEGQPVPQRGREPHAPTVCVTTDYFRAMGIPLEAGRPFETRDTATSPPVAIVNVRFAQKFFHAANVVGKHVQWFQLGDNAPWTTIVGVVGNVRQDGAEAPPTAELYVPESQRPGRNLHLAIRSRNHPLALARGLRSAVWSIDKDLPVDDIATMEERMSRSGAGRTLETLLLTSFAVLALLLAAVGIYGVVSEVVNQRTREIGLRMALGAQAPDVLRMVMRRGLGLAVAGIAIGGGAGRYLSKYLASLLFGVKPTDVGSLAGAAVVLLGVVLLAGYLPARRASRIDPVAALRSE